MSGGNLGPGSLYNVSPSQSEIDALTKFDLSTFSGNAISNGTLTITDAGLCCNNDIPGNLDTSLDTSLSIYPLSAAYDPNNATLADVPYSAATLVDTESYSIPSSFAEVPLTFNISSALLKEWANDPSSNYGFIIVESSDYTAPGGPAIPTLTGSRPARAPRC